MHSAYAAGFQWRPLRRMFITRRHRMLALRDGFEHIQPTHLRRSAGRRGPLQKFQSALNAQLERSGSRKLGAGELCESRTDNSHSAIYLIRQAARARPLLKLNSTEVFGSIRRSRAGPPQRPETTLLSIREPHTRPLMALSQRFRSCTGTSVL